MKTKSKRKASGPEMKTLPLLSLKPAPYNPRTITPEALKGLAVSIKRWGLVEPIIVNRRGLRVIGGHQRLQVLKDAGEKKCLCVVLDLPDAEEKALNVSLNNPLIQGDFTDDPAALVEQVKTDLEDLPAEELRLDDLIASLTKDVGDFTDGDAGGHADLKIKSQYDVLVTCETEQKQTELLEKLTAKGYQCRALIS